MRMPRRPRRRQRPMVPSRFPWARATTERPPRQRAMRTTIRAGRPSYERRVHQGTAGEGRGRGAAAAQGRAARDLEGARRAAGRSICRHVAGGCGPGQRQERPKHPERGQQGRYRMGEQDFPRSRERVSGRRLRLPCCHRDGGNRLLAHAAAGASRAHWRGHWPAGRRRPQDSARAWQRFFRDHDTH